MDNLLQRAWRTGQEDGIMSLISQSIHYLSSNQLLFRSPVRKEMDTIWSHLRDNGINICYNHHTTYRYDPDKKNVLLAMESPAVIEHEGWLDPELEFHAEISFNNFYDLENYYCCRGLYVGYDGFVAFDPAPQPEKKSKLVSMVYSNKKYLPGHKLRHTVGSDLSSHIDLFGSGTGQWLDEKATATDPYMFQVVIENGKYPEYVSEKFFDCLKRYTIPIYYGGETAVRKLGFDPDGIIFFDSLSKLRELLTERISPDLYYEMTGAARNNRERLRELRNEAKYQLYLNSVMKKYFHSPTSRQTDDYEQMNFELD